MPTAPTLTLSAPYAVPGSPGLSVDLVIGATSGDTTSFNVYESASPAGPWGAHVNTSYVLGPTYRVAVPASGTDYYTVTALGAFAATESGYAPAVAVAPAGRASPPTRRRVCG